MNLNFRYDPFIRNTLEQVSGALIEGGLSQTIADIDHAMFATSNLTRSFSVKETKDAPLLQLKPFAELTLWEIKTIAENRALTPHLKMLDISTALDRGGYGPVPVRSSPTETAVLDWSSTCS